MIRVKVASCSGNLLQNCSTTRLGFALGIQDSVKAGPTLCEGSIAIVTHRVRSVRERAPQNAMKAMRVKGFEEIAIRPVQAGAFDRLL